MGLTHSSKIHWNEKSLEERLRDFGVKMSEERRKLINPKTGKGHTQDSFAQETGIELDRIRAFEQGRRFPQYEDLMKLCDTFGCTVDFLFGENEYHTHEGEFICEKTGLSEKAVETLSFYLNDGYRSFCQLIAALIEDSGVEMVEETWMESGITYSERMRNGGNFLYLMYQLIYKNCGPSEGVTSHKWGDGNVLIFGGDIYRAWLLRLFESMSKFVENQRKEKDMQLYKNTPFYDPDSGSPLGLK